MLQDVRDVQFCLVKKEVIEEILNNDKEHQIVEESGIEDLKDNTVLFENSQRCQNLLCSSSCKKFTS